MKFKVTNHSLKMPKGKKKKFIAARKEVMEKIIQQIELDNSGDSSYDDKEYMENLSDEKETYMQLDMFHNIRNHMLSYVKAEFLPLCEYLRVDDIEEFINKIAA